MKIKTSELTGHALSWAVAKAVYTDGRRIEVHEMGGVRVENSPSSGDRYGIGWFNFRATDWCQCGPIIEREIDNIERREGYFYAHRFMRHTGRVDRNFKSYPDEREAFAYGQTMLIAGLRCWLKAKLGDEVDVPEGLA